MEQTEKIQNEELVGNVFTHLEKMKYRPDSIRHYRNVYDVFLKYTHEVAREQYYSPEVIADFLAFKEIPAISNPTESSTVRLYRAAMRVLAEYALHGCFQRRRCSSVNIVLPHEWEKVLAAYYKFCTEQRGTRNSTMRNRRFTIPQFLHFANCRGVNHLSDISPAILSDFVASKVHLKPITLALVVGTLRSFMSYLHIAGIASANLSYQVPKVRIWEPERIPPVWKADEIDRLLAVVDRTSPMGKRDYAILLLAAKLGIRVGDIRNLRLENFRWDDAVIEIQQSKNGETLTLPISEETGWAIIDYLKNGRPESQCREVFLRVNAPYEPLGKNHNMYDIITRYRRLAGIGLEREKRRGMHSLRHTVATRLLESGTSMDLIADILGHVSSETTRIYTRVDIETLRSAAIELEEVHND